MAFHPAAHRRPMGPGARAASPLLFLLLAKIFQELRRYPVFPIVTAALLGANITAHLPIREVQQYLQPVHSVCLSPVAIMRDGQWPRLLVSAFVHGDDSHLYFNMLSLLYKGTRLEGMLGSEQFGVMVVALLVMTHGLYLIVAVAARAVMGDGQLYYSCAVGFSGVLFALKTVLNHWAPQSTSIGGILVPSRWAAWIELLLIHLMVPNSSFAGHLCGILAGLLYMYVPKMWPTLRSFQARPVRTYGSGTWGDVRHQHPAPTPSPPQPSPHASASFNNPEEDLYPAAPATASANYGAAPAASVQPDVHDVRAARLRRFGQ